MFKESLDATSYVVMGNIGYPLEGEDLNESYSSDYRGLVNNGVILKIPIGSAFDDTKKIQIFYRLTTTSQFPYAILIGNSNVDGLTTPISVPSISGTEDTTPQAPTISSAAVITGQAAVNISNEAGSSRNPAVAVSGNNVHVAWIKETSPQEIHYKKSTDGGNTFAAVDLFTNAHASGQSGEIRWPDIAVSGNTVHIVGVAEYYPSYPNFSVIYQKSTNGGQTFDSFQTLYVVECCPLTRISANGNNVHILTNGLQNDRTENWYWRIHRI